MNIYEALDRYNIDKIYLTPDIRYKISQTYDQDTWIKATKLFLKGIGSNHNIMGKTLQPMYDMCNLADKGITLTYKQMIYLASNLIDYWDEVNYEIRNQLYV